MKDIKQDDSGDLDFSTGDLAMTESTVQHQRDILLTRKGLLKRSLITGVGVEDFLLDDSPSNLIQETKVQYIKDGMTVDGISISGGKLLIDASYDQ